MEPISGRVLIRYKENAERLDIPLDKYLQQGQSGKRYCSRCLKWKRRSSFREYSHTTTYYSGICKACTPGKAAHKSQNSATWGPSIRAAKSIGCTITEYLFKRKEGFRWCTDHKDWFDARDMIVDGKQITKCRPCNATRQADFRRRRKVSKNLKLEKSEIGEKDGLTQGQIMHGEDSETQNNC